MQISGYRDVRKALKSTESIHQILFAGLGNITALARKVA